MSVECQMNKSLLEKKYGSPLNQIKPTTVVHIVNIYPTIGCLLQIKYKQSAEMEKANFTSVVDTPEIIHAQQVKNLSSQVRTFVMPSLKPQSRKNGSPSINTLRDFSNHSFSQ